MKTILYVNYIDDKYDYYKLKVAGEEYFLCGTGRNIRRTDSVIVNKIDENIFFSGYDNTAGIEFTYKAFPLDKERLYNQTKKLCPVYFHASEILSFLGLCDFNDVLCERADTKTAEKIINKITGLDIKIGKTDKLYDVIGSVLKKLNLYENKNIIGIAEENDIVCSEHFLRYWFGETHGETQIFGLMKNLIFPDEPLFYDDLCGLCYNLLFIKINGKRNLIRLCEENKELSSKIPDTYERDLVYAYYEYFGVSVNEKKFHDINGKVINGFFVPGANLNHTYLNEYTTVDRENYLFCALSDRRVRKWGRGIPVLYNRKTKKTIMLHNRMNMRCYGMLMSYDKKVYFTADENIYCYDINDNIKTVIYTEPDGCRIQEIPTITNDGKYLLFFYGTELEYRPDRACVIDLQTKKCRVVLDKDWVCLHFKNAYNPFAGHFIINPERKNIINFLHGGPLNVKDRMWLLDTDTDRKWEPYKQIMKENNEFAEALSHWVWSHDGKRLYFIRMDADPEKPFLKNGICYIDTDEKNPAVKVYESDMRCIDAVPDLNDEFFVVDNYIMSDDKKTFSSDVFLYSTKYKKEILLYKIYIKKNHPGHSHPQFSSDGKEIIFTFSWDNKDVTCVGVKNVENEKKGEKSDEQL